MSKGEFFSNAKLIIAVHWKARCSKWIIKSIFAALIWSYWMVAHHYCNNHMPLRIDRFELRDESLNISALRPLKLEGEHAVYYAPKNDFTDRLMQNFRNACFPRIPQGDRSSSFNISIEGFANETQLLKAYRRIQILEWNSLYVGPARTNYAGVIFASNISEASKTLDYKIQSMNLGYNQLFYEQSDDWWSSSGDDYLTKVNRILSTQTCLDASFIKLKTEKNPNCPKYNMTLKRLNLPNERDFSKDDYAYSLYVNRLVMANALILTTLLVLVSSEVSYTSEEYKNGIWILFESIGVSRTIYYFISYIFSIAYLSFVIIVGAVLCRLAGSFFIQSDISIVIMLLITFSAHYLMLLISLFFVVKSTFWTNVIYFAYSVSTLSLPLMPLKNFSSFTLFILEVFFPSAVYFKLLRMAEYMEMNAEGLLWKDVLNFSNLSTPQVAVGFAMLISILFVIYLFSATKLTEKLLSIYYLDVQIKSESSSIYPNVQEPNLKSKPIIKFENVNVFNKVLNKDASLKNISMEFYEKEITSIIEECNGLSNHTLLTALSEPKLAKMSTKIPKHKTGIFTKLVGMDGMDGMDCFIANLTIRDNLRFMAQFRFKGRSNNEIEQEINDIAQTFQLSHRFTSTTSNYLKKGEQRRLSLAMAMVGGTDLVLLNNPTKGLDEKDKWIIWDALQKLKNYKKAIIVSTDCIWEATVISDRIAVLTNGKLKCYGTRKYVEELYAPKAYVGSAADKWKESILTDEEFDYFRNLDRSSTVAVKPTLTNFFSAVYEPIDIQELVSPFAGYKKSLNDNNDVKKRYASLRDALRYTLKKHLLRSSLIFLMSTILGLLLLEGAEIISISNRSVITVPETISITPNLYRNAETYISAFNESLENNYDSSGNWKSVKLAGGNLTNALYQRAKDQLATFGTRLVAAAEFVETVDGTVVGSTIFTSKPVYSMPISLNLANNALLKYLTDFEHGINVHLQRIPSMDFLFATTADDQWVPIAWAFFLLFYLVILVRNFFFLPLEENVKRMKHLQCMAGMSRKVYWGYLTLYHFLLVVPCVAIVLSTIFYLDIYRGAHFHTRESINLISVSFLCALMSGLGICYVFSCIKMNKSFVARTMMGTIIITGILDFILIPLTDSNRNVAQTLNMFGYFSPFHAFFMSIVSICQTATINNKCKLMSIEYQDSNCTKHRSDICCHMQCYDGVCKYPLNYMKLYGDNIPLLIPYSYTVILPIFIFFVLYLMESPRKFCYLYFSHLRSKTTLRTLESVSESMVIEKHIISQKVTELSEKNYTFANQHLQNNKQKPSNATCLDEEVIVVHQLYKRPFVRGQLVHDVSFRVRKGECLGIVGPHKAGKSTLLELVVGAQTPEAGWIFIEGNSLTLKQNEVLEKVAYCPQENFLYDKLTVAEHFHIFSKLRRISEKLEAAETEYWSNLFQIKKYLKSQGSALNTNVRKRTMMALTLMGGPEILVLDEPTAGCNAYSKRIIWTIIKSLKATRCTILLATDNEFSEANVLCDRVCMMEKGQFVVNLIPRGH